MNLLADLPFDGYPTEYLLARLRGRGALVPPDRPIIPSDDRSEERESREAPAWLYRQMNRNLRQTMTPVFTVLELRTLILCLRNKSSRALDTVQNLLSSSLWSAELKRILLADQDLPAAVGAASLWLTHRLEDFAGLPAAFDQNGLRGFEGELYHRYLRASLAGRHPPAVRLVLTHLVDLRNLLAVYKKLRWELITPCVYLAGGTLSLATLKNIERTGRVQAMESLLGPIAGERKVSAEGIETALMDQLRRNLRRSGRVGDPFGAILDFLWSHFIRDRNSRLRHLCADLDPGTLDAELVA